MISKELKSQINILRETNPEYIQTLKDSITESFKAKLQSIKPSSTEEEEQLNIELKDIESGISMYGHYIACKCLDISSEEEYMNQLTDIRILTNELEPC